MAHTYQWVLLPFLASSLIYYLIQMNNNWFSDSQDMTIIVIQIKVTVFVFLTKFCVCYDNNLEQPWIDGAFGGLSHIYVFLLSVVLSINGIISYSIFRSNLLSMFCLFVLIPIQIWSTILIVKLWQKRNKERKTTQNDWDVVNVTKVGLPVSVANHYEKLFAMKTVLRPIGSSAFATTYSNEDIDEQKSLFSKSDNKYALKIIDINQYIRYRFGSTLTTEEEAQEVCKFKRDYKFLTLINHQNIAKIKRADRVITLNGILRRIVLVTKLAEYSLSSYLKDEAPDGVQQNCARFWFKQVIDGVYYLHCQLNRDQPIAHMNIKPENILLYATDRLNKEFNVKLSDCGLDLYFPKSGQITTDNDKYLISAPEYILGHKITRFQGLCLNKDAGGLASDMYSLGVILVLLIRGEISKFAETPKQIERISEKQTVVNAIYVDFSWKSSRNSAKKLFAKKEDKQLKHLLKGMLERKPENRYDVITVRNHPWFQNPN